MSNTERILYIVICGSSSAFLVQDFIPLAQEANWDICLIATPEGKKFINIPLLEQLTGRPIRFKYKHPNEPDLFPRADAILVFPATFNTINKWALGIADTLALGVLCEYTGLKLPILAIPCFRTGGGLDGHPAFFKSLEVLKSYGVHILYEPERYPPKNRVPGEVILSLLEKIMKEHPGEGVNSEASSI